MPDLTPGKVVELGPLVRRVLAPNPSAMTGPGTNTYLIGRDDLAVLDPGPDDHEEHLDAVAAAGAGRIRWILVTHTHPDHAPGAAGLKARTGAEVLGYDERDGFVPDRTIGDGFVLTDGAARFRLRAMHTPGHASNHLCYVLDPPHGAPPARQRILFSGDHIMNGSTVVIGPPDGDMTTYLASLADVARLDLDDIYPGHGDVIVEPKAKIDEYVEHRLAREREVLGVLEAAPHGTTLTPEQLAATIYPDLIEELRPRARATVWAHLRRLAQLGRAHPIDGDLDEIESAWTARV
jgi:glyoxylase-like metal-dependent hydrolase (beta-lactamase superfamily II)